jgi:hypothetical protein
LKHQFVCSTVTTAATRGLAEASEVRLTVLVLAAAYLSRCKVAGVWNLSWCRHWCWGLTCCTAGCTPLEHTHTHTCTVKAVPSKLLPFGLVCRING